MLIYLAIKVKDRVLPYTANIQLLWNTHIYSILLLTTRAAYPLGITRLRVLVNKYSNTVCDLNSQLEWIVSPVFLISNCYAH